MTRVSANTTTKTQNKRDQAPDLTHRRATSWRFAPKHRLLLTLGRCVPSNVFQTDPVSLRPDRCVPAWFRVRNDISLREG